ncbi:MAG TPA: hypothetical protein VFZ23_00775 [Pyrinomonadaceae bacterium]
MKLDRVFQIVAVILAGIAAYFLWQRNNDGAFISAVLGCVAFFLSIRFQVKERNRIREVERDKGASDQS